MTSAGTLTLNGNYVQGLAGFLDIELATSALFDRFLVNGTANLDGTLALSCLLGCVLNDGDVFVILHSTGDPTGSFASVTTSGFSAGFDYNLIYDYAADLVRLQIVRAGSPDLPPSNPVAAPATLTLLAAGLGAIAAIRRGRRSRD